MISTNTITMASKNTTAKNTLKRRIKFVSRLKLELENLSGILEFN